MCFFSPFMSEIGKRNTRRREGEARKKMLDKQQTLFHVEKAGSALMILWPSSSTEWHRHTHTAKCLRTYWQYNKIISKLLSAGSVQAARRRASESKKKEKRRKKLQQHTRRAHRWHSRNMYNRIIIRCHCVSHRDHNRFMQRSSGQNISARKQAKDRKKM